MSWPAAQSSGASAAGSGPNLAQLGASLAASQRHMPLPSLPGLQARAGRGMWATAASECGLQCALQCAAPSLPPHLAAGHKRVPLLARLLIPACWVKHVGAAVGGVAAWEQE